MATAGPGLYSEIGKKARDLLYKDYHTDQKFTPTTYASNGAKSAKAEPQYLHHHAGVAASVGLNANPAVNLSGVFGTKTVAVGADASFDTSSGDLTKYNAATLYPYVTGTSVIALKYKDGVIMACDTGASYGSTLRYKSVERIKAVGKHSLIGASGEFSDFQEILRYLDELTLSDHMWDDGNSLGPKEIHSYLTRVMYNRRNKFDPLWNSLVLGGVKKGPKSDEKYLGMVNMIGTHFEENHVATGFGNHLAIPILRAEWREDMTFEEAVKLVEKCLLVLLYRDRSSINKFQIAKITTEGSTIYPPYSLKTYWGFSHFENPAQGAVGSW